MRNEPRGLPISFLTIGAVTAVAAGITAGVTAAGVTAAAVGPSGASGSAALAQALARAVIVGLPTAVALYACRSPAHARFGKRLLIVSGLWFIASWSNSASPLLFSVGRMAGWLAEVGLVYALLSFPGGRLLGRPDRALVAASIAVLTTLYLPSVLFVERFPAPSAVSSCSASCPGNAFMVAGPWAFIGSYVNPIRDGITVVIFLLVAARLTLRIRDANRLLGTMLVPVLGVAIARLVGYVVVFVTRRVDPGSTLLPVGTWFIALTMPALAVAFLVGLARWHMFVNRGLRIINVRLREMPGPLQVQRLLASAFADPGLQIATWSSRREHWIDVAGEPLDPPLPGSGRYLTDVRDGWRQPVAIVHDEALRYDSAFAEAAATAATVALERDRVAARTARMVGELRASRSRILAAADGERRRIERDLHDGAQQRLVALSIRLQMAAEKAERERPEDVAGLLALAGEVEQALDDMRSLTRDVYPAVLADRGLEAAVRSAALRSPVAARVDATGLGEYPQELAAAVYFCCLEALQNVAKHARTAESVRIVLRESDSVLHFSISDDGPGMPDDGGRTGAGLINMDDRITTIGGQLQVRSRPGHGTSVTGRVPLATPSVRTGSVVHLER